MAKYKICPHCKFHNESRAIECVKCETDLSGVKPTDDENEAAKAAAVPAEDDGTPPMAVPVINSGKMVRVCEACGAQNPPNAQKCSCGEDISDVIPTPGTTPTENPVSAENQESSATSINPLTAFSLVSSDGYTFNMTRCCVIGRENEMSEYLSKKPFVSRKHAELSIVNGKLYVKNLSSTNYTYVNNVRIGTEYKELNNGDDLSLGGNYINGIPQNDAAYFKVRVN